MAESKKCPNCGSELRIGKGNGLCPVCVISSLADDEFDGGDILPEDLEFAGYTDLEKIGQGGMSHVFKARHEVLEREVAIKILSGKLSTDPEFQERFVREAKAMAKLEHPNIVSIYDFGETESGIPYFTMELVEGVTLRELIREGMAPAQILDISTRICDALQHAHGMGFVHRDIKPGNILISKDGKVKVADFGLSKSALHGESFSALTMTDVSMGTPDYMAPEQIEASGDVDLRADIYALGVVLYEMFTGTVPRGTYRLPSKCNKQVSKGVDTLVEKAMQREPADRFSDASEVKTSLQIAGRKMGVETAGGADRRNRRFANKGRLLMALAAAAVVVGCTLTAMKWRGEFRGGGIEELANLPAGRPVLVPLSAEIEWERSDFSDVPRTQSFVQIESAGNRTRLSKWFAGLERNGEVFIWGPATQADIPLGGLEEFPPSTRIISGEKRLFAMGRGGEVLRSDLEGRTVSMGFPVKQFTVGHNFFMALSVDGKLASGAFGYYPVPNRFSLPEGADEMEFSFIGSSTNSNMLIRSDGKIFFNSSTKPVAEAGEMEVLPVHIEAHNRTFFLTMPDGSLRHYNDGEFLPLPDPVLEEVKDAEECKFGVGRKSNFLAVKRMEGRGWHIFEGGSEKGVGAYKRRPDLEKRVEKAIDLALGDRYLVALIPD